MIYEALTVTTMQIKNNVNKPGIINRHMLLQIRWGHLSFLKWNVFHSDLRSIFSFNYCWNFSWVFAEALTTTFKRSICTFLRKTREKLLLSKTLAWSSPHTRLCLLYGEEPCPVMSSQADLRVLQSTWGLVPPKPWQSCAMRNKSNLPAQGSSCFSTAPPEVLPGWARKLHSSEHRGCAASSQLRLSGFKNYPVPRFDASKQ